LKNDLVLAITLIMIINHDSHSVNTKLDVEHKIIGQV